MTDECRQVVEASARISCHRAVAPGRGILRAFVTSPDYYVLTGDPGFRVYRIAPDGSIVHVAGGGTAVGVEEVPATDAQLDRPSAIEVGPDGSVLIAEYRRSRYIAGDGTLRPLIGAHNPGDAVSGIGGPTITALLAHTLWDVTVGPDGAVYVASSSGVYRASTAATGFTLAEKVVAASDGREAYVFDAYGRHSYTYDGIAGVAKWIFGYVPDYMVRHGVTYRLVSDHLGSVVAVVDVVTGQLVQEREYDAWGRMLSENTEPGFSQPFGFAGGIWDADVRLVRFGARDYDPETGRWVMKDPIHFQGGDTNLYGYVVADPVNLFDPNGMELRPSYGNPDDATRDWADEFYDPGIQPNEICTPFFSFELNLGRGPQTRYYTPGTPNPGSEDGRNPWRRNPGQRPPGNAAGDCHTHGAPSDDVEADENFSRDDINNCRSDNTGPCYVFTPRGGCLKYTPGKGVEPC